MANMIAGKNKYITVSIDQHVQAARGGCIARRQKYPMCMPGKGRGCVITRHYGIIYNSINMTLCTFITTTNLHVKVFMLNELIIVSVNCKL